METNTLRKRSNLSPKAFAQSLAAMATARLRQTRWAIGQSEAAGRQPQSPAPSAVHQSCEGVTWGASILCWLLPVLIWFILIVTESDAFGDSVTNRAGGLVIRANIKDNQANVI
ncbi:hypothetical protein GWI33_001678 [Rhynchophorus ferrugineus]|uniref:Uncharacterized protein n=1 Tax=Rhynchophorus ferrugineus TaxID=354439 RepID=A0A834IXN6_RHYFE|nr:hypothetical protein GWI33_001678 [Rhynchophorus ferrugineus]